MSYQSQALLAQDPIWIARVSACDIQQANIYVNDTRKDISAFAESILRFEGAPQSTMFAMTAAAPGIGDEVDNGDGTISVSNVTDQAILSAVQVVWPTAAAAYYDENGVLKTAFPPTPGVIFTYLP